MRRGWAAILLALGLCACANNAPEPPPVPVPAAPLPPMSSGFETTSDAQPSPPGDMCGASRLQWLVGKPKTEIPVPVDPSLRRVACTSCPITMDFNPRRLNILFDEASGVVKEVKCG